MSDWMNEGVNKWLIEWMSECNWKIWVSESQWMS